MTATAPSTTAPPAGPVADPPVAAGRLPTRAQKLGDRYAALLLTMALVYAIGDRWVALLLRVPGTPLYSGELLLAIGVAFYAVHTAPLRRTVNRFVPIFVAFLMMLWMAIRLVPGISAWGTFAVRDAAIFYYTLFGALFVTACYHSPHVFARAVHRYVRFVPWLATFFPVAYALGALVDMPYLPGTEVQILTVRPSNIALHVGLCLATALFAPEALMNQRRRVYTLSGAGATAIMLATQNRSGFLATCLLLFVAFVYARPKGVRSVDRVAIVVGILAVFLAAFWASGISISTDRSGREVSAEQFFDVIENLASGGRSGEEVYTRTVSFRDELWRLAWRETRLADAELVGLGFGQPLGTRILPLHGNAQSELRNPHNSHLDVLVRTGFVGLTLWITMWLSWFGSVLLRGRRRRLTPLNRYVVTLAIGAIPAMLFNSYFEPTLETIQQAMWAMVLFAMGLIGSTNMLPDPGIEAEPSSGGA